MSNILYLVLDTIKPTSMNYLIEFLETMALASSCLGLKSNAFELRNFMLGNCRFDFIERLFYGFWFNVR